MSGYVRKRGRKWYYCFEIETQVGTRKRVERVAGDTKREAQVALRNALNEYDSGFIEPTNMSFNDFLDEWFALFVEDKLKRTTTERYRGLIKKYIRPGLGHLKLQKVKPIHIEKMLKEYSLTDISSTTLQHIYTLTNNIFNRAIKMQVLSRNPCDFVDRPKRDKFIGNTLSVKEFFSILDTLDISSYRDYIFTVALQLELELGLRRGELAGLEWKNIDFKENTLKIKNNLVYVHGHTYMTTPKSLESIRTLYISSGLISFLKEYKNVQNKNKLYYGENYCKNVYDNKEYDIVLTWENGKGIHPLYYTKRFNKLMKKSSIDKPVRFHDLRHTNASLLVAQGVDFKTIQIRLGHADINTTLNIYSHVSIEMQKSAVQKLTSEIYGDKLATK